MDTNLDNILVRKSNSYNAGPIGFDLGEERYIAKAQGLVGFEIFAEDKISIKNIEGKQECEVVVFDKKGFSNTSIIKQKSNGDAKFIKHVLTNSNDKKLLLLVGQCLIHGVWISLNIILNFSSTSLVIIGAGLPLNLLIICGTCS